MWIRLTKKFRLFLVLHSNEKVLDTKQCVRAFKRLGFFLGNKRIGRHDKFFPPKNIADGLVGRQPRFIMIPRHTVLHCQSEIISELKAMGGEDLVRQFKENL